MYSAKEAAEMTGLSTATLRYYEKEQKNKQTIATDCNSDTIVKQKIRYIMVRQHILIPILNG